MMPFVGQILQFSFLKIQKFNLMKMVASSKRKKGISFSSDTVDNAGKTKRTKDDNNDELGDEEEREALSKLGSTDIKALMSSDMSTVSCVLIKVDGTCEGLELDMTPRLKMTQKTLNGEITFLGAYDDIQCILILNREKQELRKMEDKNNAKLQPPFHEADVYGDILITRSDDNGDPLPFTLKEYEEYQKKDIKEFTVDLDEEIENNEDDDEDDDDDEEEEDEGEEEEGESDEEDEGDALQELYLGVMRKKVIEQYKAIHNEEPDEEYVTRVANKLLNFVADSVPGEGGGEEEEEEEGDDAPAENIFGFGAPPSTSSSTSSK